MPELDCQMPSEALIVSLCGSGDEYFTSVAITGSGTIIAGGWSNSTDGWFAAHHAFGADNRGFMAYTDPAHYPWTQHGDQVVHAAKTAPGGLVVVVGESESNPNTATVSKFDGRGNRIWQTSFQHEDLVTSFYGVAIRQDGAIVAWGLANVPGANPDQSHVVMAQFDSGGQLVWSRDYGEAWTGMGMPEGVTVDADGNIFLVGVAMLNDGSDDWGKAMMSKFSPSGELVWSKTFVGSIMDGFFDVTTAPNGNLVAVGVGSIAEDDTFPGVLAIIDQSGNLVSVWTHVMERATEFKAITPTPDGGYAIAGTTGTDNDDAVVLKVRDLNAINGPDFLTWQQRFGGSGEDKFESVAVFSSGYIVVVGSSTSVDGTLPPSRGGMDAIILKLTSDGQVVAF